MADQPWFNGRAFGPGQMNEAGWQQQPQPAATAWTSTVPQESPTFAGLQSREGRFATASHAMPAHHSIDPTLPHRDAQVAHAYAPLGEAGIAPFEPSHQEQEAALLHVFRKHVSLAEDQKEAYCSELEDFFDWMGTISGAPLPNEFTAQLMEQNAPTDRVNQLVLQGRLKQFVQQYGKSGNLLKALELLVSARRAEPATESENAMKTMRFGQQQYSVQNEGAWQHATYTGPTQWLAHGAFAHPEPHAPMTRSVALPAQQFLPAQWPQATVDPYQTMGDFEPMRQHAPMDPWNASGQAHSIEQFHPTGHPYPPQQFFAPTQGGGQAPSKLLSLPPELLERITDE